MGTDRDNEDRVLVKKEWLQWAEETLVEEDDLTKRIREAQGKDERVVKAVEELKKLGIKSIKDEEWSIEDGLVLKEGKIYVPEEALRVEVIRWHHDTAVGGHGGRWKTTELVGRNYWWPGMTKEVAKYVEGCDLCQRHKNQVEAPAGKLMPNSIPKKPWRHISADFIVKLPLAQGYDAILVVCDQLTKMVHFIPTTEKTSAVGLARLFRDNVWKLHGLLESIILDRGVQFTAGMMKELNERLGIRTKLSTAYHPQIDEQTEQVNQELEQYLRMFVDHRQEQWPKWLGTAEFAYNNKKHTVTQILLFEANYGLSPRMGFEGRRGKRFEAAGEFTERMRQVQEEVKAALGKAQEEMRKYTDRKKREGAEFKIGDLVLLSTKELKWHMKGRRSEKLTEQFVRPYKVKSIISANIVELQLPPTVHIHPVVNVSKLQMYKSQIEGQKATKPAPVIVEGEEEFEVEKILNKRKIREKEKFLVRWKGYTVKADTWEDRGNLKNAGKLVEEFEREYREEDEEVRRQEQTEEEKEFDRGLLGEYTAKLIHGWGNRKYERERERRWDENWSRWKHSLGQGILRGGSCYNSDLNPKLSPAFIGLLNNLRDYNIPKSIYSSGQVTPLHR